MKQNCSWILVFILAMTFPFSSSAMKELAFEYDEAYFSHDEKFKKFMIKYKSLVGYKAIAIAEKKDGTYYSRYAYKGKNQSEANSEALRGCEKFKPIDVVANCRLYMVGTYIYDTLPKLGQMKGVWEGEIIQFKLGASKHYGSEVISNFRLVNCEHHPQVWVSASEYGGGNELHQISRVFNIETLKGNITLSSITHSQGWVETQVWTFVVLDEQNAVVQRNRLVNNFTLDLSNSKRFMGSIGHGNLRRISKKCNNLDYE